MTDVIARVASGGNLIFEGLTSLVDVEMGSLQVCVYSVV
jgi:hypothetical protein